MIKTKPILFLSVILLYCNFLCFSQTNTFYVDLITENSSKYEKFQKNFNPIKHDPAILKNCFIEILNDLRQQLHGSLPLVHIPMLDSVAQMNVEFQTEREVVTIINDPPHKYTSVRLRVYGFTPQADEFASKAKAYLGDKEYSYYDLCLELLKPLLKSSKDLPAILSPQYTIYGFAYKTDQNMRFMYISLVLGNDLTIQESNVAIGKQRTFPTTKGSAGLMFSDEAICKKRANDPTLEQIYDMLYWNENGDVFLQSDDAKSVKRLLTKAGDAIVLDFIQKDLYKCPATPLVDNNKPFRGIVSKPVSMAKIIAANDSTPKSNLFHAKIGSIPQQIELDVAIDINILLLSKKYICRTLIRKNVSDIPALDAITDSLIQMHNYEEALYRLAPMLADSAITEPLLFSIVQLAAHRPRTFLSSIFTQSVQMAALRNPQKLCRLFRDFSISVLDNVEVRKIYCSTCK